MNNQDDMMVFGEQFKKAKNLLGEYTIQKKDEDICCCEEVAKRLDKLERKIDLIFGNHILVNRKWIQFRTDCK